MVEIVAVEADEVDTVVGRVSAHDHLAGALAPCAAVLGAIVEDVGAKADCYRDIDLADEANPPAAGWVGKGHGCSDPAM